MDLEICQEIKKEKKRIKKSQKCIVEDCSKHSIFNLKGLKAQFCNLHKTNEMQDVRHKFCEFDNCKTRAGFNFEGESPKYCSVHAEKGMIELNKRTCIKCKKKAIFNFTDETKAKYCFEHKEPLMCDIVNKKCLKCNKQPHYNFPENKGGILCNTHAELGMEDVVNKRCIFENCKKQPSFNFPEQSSRLYCSVHKLEKMIDIVSKKCLDCDKSPCFNYENETIAIYCFQHAKNLMVDVVHKKCLECNTRPNYNYENETSPLYCIQHAKNSMVDITHHKCQTPLCQIRPSNPQYDGYCLRCFIYTFPDKPVTRNYKTKEKEVNDFINNNFSDKSWIFDKRVQDGCSLNRPDSYCDLGDKILIVETDENQHTSYDTTCEIARLNQLSQDVYFRPIVMVRFNPDAYINEKGIKIKSPWTIGKDGILRITDREEWNKRLNILKETIENSFETKPSDLITFHYLFYNDSQN
jgi:hypothetical protein